MSWGVAESGKEYLWQSKHQRQNELCKALCSLTLLSHWFSPP